MLNWIEGILAQWTGRSAWPEVSARFEERMSTGQGDSQVPLGNKTFENEITDDIFSYEVQGKTYTAAVEEIAGHGATVKQVGHHIRIQYNPERPEHIYYAPACALAGKLVAVGAVFAAAAAIGISVAMHKR